MQAWSRVYVTALEAAIQKKPFASVGWPELGGPSIDAKIWEMSPPKSIASTQTQPTPNQQEIDEKIRQMSANARISSGAAAPLTPPAPAMSAAEVEARIREMSPPSTSGRAQAPVGPAGTGPNLQAQAAVPPPVSPSPAGPPAAAQRPGQVADVATPPTPATAATAAPAPSVSAQDLARLSAEIAKLRDELKSRPPAAEAAAPAPSPAPAGPAAVNARRLAFVIGNDGYQSVTKLQNARTDAKAMADMLTRAGYRVRMRLDLTERAMKDELRAFKSEIQGGDEVLFFFAGHGVQLAGANYLLPTDVRSDSEDQVRDDALPLQKVLDDIQDRKARFALAIVDACRDNPFKGAGRNIGTRGLAPTAAATGQMVMFSAGAGQQALDRLGDRDREPNGLFTRVLLKEMEKPGISVDRVLRNVRTQVVELARTVGHEQVPALYDQSIGEFYFRR